MGNEQSIAQLKSLGPKSQKMLVQAGVTSVDQLRALGSIEVYVRAKRSNKGVSLNLLWALESALTGQPWQEVARVHRTSLLLALEEREKNI
ncbi:TfoX/Sxy family protein [Methylobacter sp. YRD-M1]|uniref:TfoX/Sxy family protein n=1 Tax=Methylobacter sp. YRD-M1 TaxID=2911520 RepID=UPI00227CEC3E|nr:TfoX/Sxy family protein [Methylobacter sp. YRD-M1]